MLHFVLTVVYDVLAALEATSPDVGDALKVWYYSRIPLSIKVIRKRAPDKAKKDVGKYGDQCPGDAGGT